MKALVVGSYDEISSLIHKNAETLTIRPYQEPEEEAKATDGQLEIVSGVTLYAFDEEEGTLDVLQVQVKNLDEKGEETNMGGTFCTFGGTLEASDPLIEGTDVSDVDNVKYEVNLEQFISIMSQQAIKAMNDVLGTSHAFDVSPEDVVVFQVAPQDGNPGKLCVSTLIKVEKKLIEDMAVIETYKKETINRIGAVGVNVGALITSFNLAYVVDETIKNLGTNHGLEPLSATNVNLIINNCINQVLSKIDYKAIRKAVEFTRASEEIAEQLSEAQA